MNISDLLQKDFWYRRVHGDVMEVPAPTNATHYKRVNFNDGVRRRAMTTDDFMNELAPSAHTINSRYFSTRPIRELVEREETYTDSEGEERTRKVKEWVITGYDDMETVRLGMQKRFALAKASFFAANGFNICNETKDTARFDVLSSWKDTAGLSVGFLELAQSVFQTAEGAIYLYQVGETIEYKVFSALYGDKLAQSYDEQHNPVVAREYTLNGRRAVDVFRTDSVETWVQGEVNEEAEDTDGLKSWWSKVRGWFKGSDLAVSEDGWQRVAKKDAQIGKHLNACVYFRIDDVVWGAAQDDIEGYERAMSYIAEECKSMAFPDMFVKAAKIDNMPPLGAHGRTWAVRGTTEDIKAADVKAIAKPDMSNIAQVDLKNRFDTIMRTTMSVFVDPELVKSSDISGVGIKVLYGPEVQWAQNMWTQFYGQLKYLMEVFKALVAKIEGDAEYTKLRVSIWQEIYLPEDAQAKVKIELDQLYARAKSRKAVMSDLGNQHLGDYEQIMKEWSEELEMKAAAKVEEKEENPDLPKVNNQAQGKSVLN